MMKRKAGCDDTACLRMSAYFSRMVTPPTATNLKGVTRETLIGLAVSLGIKMEEKPLTLFDVWTAKEVFICGTGAEVVPVLSVDDRTIGSGTVGPVTSRISARIRIAIPSGRCNATSQ